MKENVSVNSAKVCFSYIRFSSKAQEGGSSLDRQSPIAEKVALEKGWTYRPDLNAADLGVSAYKGDNLKTITAILEAVKSGKIPKQAVMVIEAFDRFSRADLDTAEDLLKLALKSGLEIYVYRGGHHLTKESINKPIDRIIALLELVAANEYSAKLSYRMREANQKKKQRIQNGEKLFMSRVPGWISPKTLQPNEKVKTVQMIYQMYLQGSSTRTIARYLNKNKIPTLTGKGFWSQGAIYTTLSNRSVLGELKLREGNIPNHFQAIITEDAFFRVQSKINDNKGKRVTGNNDSKIVNLFSGVGYCSCGQKIKVTKSKNGYYMTCYGHVLGFPIFGNTCGFAYGFPWPLR